MTTQLLKNLCISVFAAGLLLITTGCEKEGPAEKAGEKIDQAVEETKENLNEARETVEDKIKTDGPAEEAGEKIDEAVEEAREEARQAKENVEEAVKTD